MPFSLGALELLLLMLIAIPTGVLYMRRSPRYRIGVAAIVCAALAAVLTPADPASMALFFVAFFGVFVFGTRYRLRLQTTVE